MHIIQIIILNTYRNEKVLLTTYRPIYSIIVMIAFLIGSISTAVATDRGNEKSNDTENIFFSNITQNIEVMIFGDYLDAKTNDVYYEYRKEFFRITNTNTMSSIIIPLKAEQPEEYGFVPLCGTMTEVLLYTSDIEPIALLHVIADGQSIIIEDLKNNETHTIYNMSLVGKIHKIIKENDPSISERYMKRRRRYQSMSLGY